MSETTFRHSQARVPRLYKEAAKIVKVVKEEGGSFKTLVHQTKQQRLLKSLYALVAETLRHSSELDALLRQTQIVIKEPRLDPWLARVLITELLWRQRPLSGPAIPLKIVQSYKSELLSKKSNLALQNAPPVSTLDMPRFVRINTLKVSKQEILDYFTHEGWIEVKDGREIVNIGSKEMYANFLKRAASLTDLEFLQDLHVPNLLVFPRKMQFYNLHYYHNGALILQDKASCLPAYLLNAPPGSTVLDMCAAPGMKTTHIAAILQNKGLVYAIERHEDRYKTLCNIVNQTGSSCVRPILGDALRFSDEHLPDVEYILIDPSCSGSGMITRQEIFCDAQDVSKERLEKLSSFQSHILRHAMTNFPKVKRIVYSTCSINTEENEAVIDEVMKTTAPNFRPIMPTSGVDWMKQGDASYTYGRFGLYARPEVDLTNGFFVAVFERSESEFIPGDMINTLVSNEESKQKKRKRKRDKQRESACDDNLSTADPSNTCTAFERMKQVMAKLSTPLANPKESVDESDQAVKTREEKKKRKEYSRKEKKGASDRDEKKHNFPGDEPKNLFEVCDTINFAKKQKSHALSEELGEAVQKKKKKKLRNM